MSTRFILWSFSVLNRQNGRRFVSFITPGISRRKSDLCNPSSQHWSSVSTRTLGPYNPSNPRWSWSRAPRHRNLAWGGTRETGSGDWWQRCCSWGSKWILARSADGAWGSSKSRSPCPQSRMWNQRSPGCIQTLEYRSWGRIAACRRRRR